MISPQATAAAQRYLRGVPPDQMMGALGGAISANPTVSLVELITAHKLLTQQQQEQEAERAKQMAMAGAGLPGLMPQQTTVAQQVTDALAASNENLEQEIMASAAQPAREGGIANLNAGRLGRDYANGGIVAFDDGGGVRRFQTAGVVTAQPTETTAGRVFRGIVDRLSNPEAEARFFEQQERYKRELEAGRAMPDIFEPLTAEQRKKSDENVARILTAPPAASTITAEGGPDAAAAAAAAYTGSNAAPAPAPAPAAAPRGPAAAPTAAANVGIRTLSPAADSADSDYIKFMNTLKDNSAEGLALLKSGIRTPETPKTAGEYAALNREQENASLKARGLPTVEESMKERLDNLATAGKEARNNRDVDRWMAAAQGFFAMAGGKSQYAMQNMADGLNIGVKELRAVEQDYRKIDQLQKDKAELLKEATRQEARGDFAKGEALRKGAEDRKDKIDAANVVIGERMTAHAGTAMGHAISAKSATDARRDAAAARTAEAGYRSDALAESKRQSEQGRTDRAKEIAAQKRTASYQRAFKEDAAYKGLQEKESAIANLGPRESLKPKQQQEYDNAVATRDALQTQISKRARAIAVREVQEDMGLQAEADSIISGKKK